MIDILTMTNQLFIRKSHHTKKEWRQNQWSKVQLIRNTKVGKKNKENLSKTIYLELHLSSCRSKLSATLILKAWDRIRQSFSHILSWRILLTSFIFINIYACSEFDASNTFQTSWGKVQQKTGKVQESCKNTCLDPLQVNRCNGNRWEHHDKGRPQKAQWVKGHNRYKKGVGLFTLPSCYFSDMKYLLAFLWWDSVICCMPDVFKACLLLLLLLLLSLLLS